MSERLTWKEIVAKYPDQWVVMDEVSKDGSTILSGVIVETCTDDEIDSYFVKTLRDGKRYTKRRTADIGGIGIVYGANYSYEVR